MSTFNDKCEAMGWEHVFDDIDGADWWIHPDDTPAVLSDTLTPAAAVAVLETMRADFDVEIYIDNSEYIISLFPFPPDTQNLIKHEAVANDFCTAVRDAWLEVSDE